MNQSIQELITELSMTYSFAMHLIVEGNNDLKFFSSAIKGKEKVNAVCAWGADNVVQIISEIDKISVNPRIAPALGIIDRDYRIPLGNLKQSPNLVITDARDLECMMFDSPSLHAVISEFGSDSKVKAFGGVKSIASTVIASANTVGKIRFHVHQLKKRTSFQRLDLSKIVDKKTLSVDPSELVKHLNARQDAPECQLPATIFDGANDAHAKATCDKGQLYFRHDLLLCRGHDLMELMAIGFRSLFGSRLASESSRDNVESLFRLNSVAHFRATPMAKTIEAWLNSKAISQQIMLV